ncbi:MAG: PaaI family thioesterase [Desulfuromonadales bacterium]|nr:PaaI family thioesterase [Desulfuromonadales bacterium]
MPEKDLQGEADWQLFDAPALVGETLRFVSGDRTGNRFRMNYFRDRRQDLVARVWFGPVTEGPPGHAHGGSIAAVLDEVLGLAAWAAGHKIVVGNLNVSFRQLLPIQTVVQVNTRVVSVEGRKIMVHGEIHSLDGQVYARGECLCIQLTEQQLATGATVSQETLCKG